MLDLTLSVSADAKRSGDTSNKYDKAVTSMAVVEFGLCMLLLVVLPAAFFFTNYPCHRRKYGSRSADQSEVRCGSSHIGTGR